MKKCEWNNCTNEATTEVTRPITDEDPNKNTQQTSGGHRVLIPVRKMWVCNDHIKGVKKTS
jgi:hypothetical protein